MNHKHAWELIPWYVNGTVSEARRDSLLFHLERCSQCRDEVQAQRALLQGMKTRQQVETMPHASLQKLMARIDADPLPQHQAASRAPRALRWLTAAVVLQGLLLGALATALLRTPRGEAPATYQTVSSPAPAAGVASIRAVFAPDMTLGELQALLERAHLRIVNGPSPDGVYTLATSAISDDPRQALLTLRAHPAARFAEPIGR
jgi:Putative zinc-finger